jgi:predicted MFS family arabinose efflux permease
MHAPSATGSPTGFSTARRNWMLAAFTLVGICSTTDRGIIATILEPIKHEFHLSDSQLGFIAGLAFAVAHAIVAIPAGALGDRISRNRLIAASLAFWSVMTALCGAAQSYITLLLARMGVGAGEAGGQAATLSSVSDLFPAERRATAISIYYLSSPIGAALAGAGGGLIASAHGWRTAMMAAAVPGVFLCLLLLFTRDVPRETRPRATVSEAAPPFMDVLRFIGGQRALIHLFIGLALITVVVSGQGAFAYSFFIRYHQMSLKEIGPLLGVASGVVGIAVMLGSGVLADWLARRDPRMRLWVIVAVFVLVSPLVILGLILPQPYAVPFYLTHIIVTGVWMGPGFATAQNLSHPRMRSTIAAIMYVVNGFVGFGLGPVVIGRASDLLSGPFGDQGLRIAMIAGTAVGFWAALHFYLASRTLKADLARAEAASVV